ncbi:hypothetical protein BDA96_02G185100 [Sorghum bicolor]|uniref:Uncharacterized protein n=1 Tax=Sorghum bicolor TaxID=4558 RepID=A0A921RMQ0_SORBI|nr:hypothetical protein BDA96_02G185100 [Sorghum bicolor]
MWTGNTRNYLPPLDLRCPRPALREPTVVLRTSGVANLRCPRLARREPALTPLATPRAASSVPERPRPAHRELREAAARPARRCPSGRAPPTASCWRPQRSPRHAPPAGVRGTPCPPVPVAAPRPPRAAGGRSEARGAPRPPVPVRRCRWPRPAHRELKSLQDEPFNFVLLDGTWSNSAALYRRLKVQLNAFLIWPKHSFIRLSRV